MEKVSIAAKGGREAAQGKKASAVPRSREESQVTGTGNLQATMLEGHGSALPDLDLSAKKHVQEGSPFPAFHVRVSQTGSAAGNVGFFFFMNAFTFIPQHTNFHLPLFSDLCVLYIDLGRIRTVSPDSNRSERGCPESLYPQWPQNMKLGEDSC